MNITLPLAGVIVRLFRAMLELGMASAQNGSEDAMEDGQPHRELYKQSDDMRDESGETKLDGDANLSLQTNAGPKYPCL
jgi:hypothetical protein